MYVFLKEELMYVRIFKGQLLYEQFFGHFLQYFSYQYIRSGF